MKHIKGLLFDKDGTLFDHDGMWGSWVLGILERLAPGDKALQEKLADSAGFDLETHEFEVGSDFVNGTSDDIVVAFRRVAPHLSAAEIEEAGREELKAVEIPPVCDLRALLGELRSKGFKLGVATNDFEQGAVDQLTRADVFELFDFVVGYDSGYGAKPGPGMIHGFCKAVGLEPEEVAMIGDSTHDLYAGKAAGAYRGGVLTGPAKMTDLVLHSDVILKNVSELPAKLS